jgi:2-succinyl-5-enolpyruvyl-6-hydroxy-3-cyclohexene-1-carboxylate synthase
MTLEKIAANFKVKYQFAKNEKETIACLNNITKNKEIEILELYTGNSNNENVLNDYFNAIKTQ